MKESDRIRKEMEEDDSDNDYRDCNYLRKLARAEKLESFREGILPKLAQKYRIEDYYTSVVIFTEQRGKITYYPKANSLLIHQNNYWVKGYGVAWIKKYLLNK